MGAEGVEDRASAVGEGTRVSSEGEIASEDGTEAIGGFGRELDTGHDTDIDPGAAPFAIACSAIARDWNWTCTSSRPEAWNDSTTPTSCKLL